MDTCRLNICYLVLFAGLHGVLGGRFPILRSMSVGIGAVHTFGFKPLKR